MKAILGMICFMAMHGASWSRPDLPQEKDDEFVEETCLPCETFFRKLEITGEGSKVAQDVKVHLRGEPKSGTGMSLDWATGALERTCDYLKQLFGEQSCRVEFTFQRDRIRTMIFEPALGAGDARCSCARVGRVTIELSARQKHTLPFDSSCHYHHSRGVESVRSNTNRDACKFANGTRIHNHDDLWQCMYEANCTVADDSLQMAVFRDPRPVAVSAYFHLMRSGQDNLGSVEDFVISNLRLMCQWVALRYIIFSGLLSDQSEEFWYEDALADPLAWHYRWFDFVGLQLPAHQVNFTADRAIENDFSFEHKHIDEHPGQADANATEVRHFDDEVTPEMLEAADSVLREWMPPVLLAKLGV